MGRPTRRSLLSALGIGVVTAGCLGTGGLGSDSNPTSPGTDTPSNPSPSPGGVTHGADEPRADHVIAVASRDSSAHDVRVAVTRESSGEVVFEETVTVPAETEREVYNLEQADPEGVEAFSVCGELADASSDEVCETIETSQCYGDAVVTIDREGSLGVVYAIC